jgi:O-antigen/teichoic acid export membrane protein
MDEYTRVLHSGLLVNVAIPIAGLCAVLPFFFSAPLTRWLQLHDTSPADASWVAALLSFQMALAIVYGLLAGIYRTVHEYARGQMIANLRFFLNLILTIAIAYAGGRLRGLAIMQLALLLTACVFVFIDLRRRRPEIQVGFSQADWRLGVQFIGPSLMFLGIQILSALVIQGSVLMVSAMFGAGVLVVFASLRTLANLIKQAAATVQHALWPEFTTLDAEAKAATMRTLHLLGAKMSMTIAVCSAAFLVCMGDRVVALWTDGRVPFDFPLMIGFLMQACSQAHWCTSSVLISACNRQETLLRWTAASALAGFLIGSVAAHWFGVAGFVFGLALADGVLCGLALPWFACRMIGESRMRFLREVTLRSAVLLVTTYGAVKLIVPLAGAAGVRGFLYTGILTCAFGAAAAYAVALNRFERDRVNAAVAGMLDR